MSAKPFLDTNILVYAFTTDDHRKHAARDLILTGGSISVQVLNEFANVSRRKLRRDWREIRDFLRLVRDCLDEPVPVTAEVHRRALDYAERHQLTIYDALIVAAAKLCGCRLLYSEDLQHGQVLDGLTIRNPFRAA